MRGWTVNWVLMASALLAGALLLGLACLSAACSSTVDCPEGKGFDDKHACVDIKLLLDGGLCPLNMPLRNDKQECVACLKSADCKDNLKPFCNASGVCSPCENNKQCLNNNPDKPICNPSGLCGQCKPLPLDAAKETDSQWCGDKSCDINSGLCTTTKVRSLITCQACQADSECQDSSRCVPMQYQGKDHGYYCLPLKKEGCETKPFMATYSAQSIGGQNAEVCSLNQNLSTCEAFTLLGDSCVNNGEADQAKCGKAAQSGSLCKKVNGGVFECTYLCTKASECKMNGLSTCSSFDAGAEYCF